MKARLKPALILVALAALPISACDVSDPVATETPTALLAVTDVPAPAPLVTVAASGSELELWPYTATSLGAPPSDPMNLLFPDADVRSLRAALLLLDGDRTPFGFPGTPPFDCTWKEAMGANQAGYSTPSGWTGSAIQLECGDYDPIRFHIRMFPAGDWTIANAHFEVLIAGTNQHQVLAWELAEQLVTVDFIRAGVLAGGPAPSEVISQAPSFRDIDPLIYNQLPPPLQGLTGGPAAPVTDPVPLGNDGRATILTLAGALGAERTVARRAFVLDFDQTIPKPFCAEGPFDFFYVQGPIQFTQQVVSTANGNYITYFHARGGLEVTPVNPLTGEPTGETMMARVAERDRSVVTDQTTLVSTVQMQLLVPRSDDSYTVFLELRLGPGGADTASIRLTCGA